MSETTHRCGSTATASGEPCQTPVSGPGETCWRESHVAGSLDHLTPKRRRFVEEYTGRHMGNATQAAIAAGYSEKTASQIGYQLLQHPSVSEAVEDRLEEQAMGSDEVLARLADMGRADMDDFVRVNENGYPVIDLSYAEEAGLLHLVKEISYDSDGRPKVKLHDSKDALKTLAKVHGLEVQKVEHSGEIDTGGDTHIYLPDNDRDDLPEQLKRREAATGNGASPP